MPEPIDHIEEQRKHHAQQDRRSQRKVKRRIFAAVENVSRKASQRQVHSSEQRKQKAGHNQHDAQDDQDFAQISHFLTLTLFAPDELHAEMKQKHRTGQMFIKGPGTRTLKLDIRNFPTNFFPQAESPLAFFAQSRSGRAASGPGYTSNRTRLPSRKWTRPAFIDSHLGCPQA